MKNWYWKYEGGNYIRWIIRKLENSLEKNRPRNGLVWLDMSLKKRNKCITKAEPNKRKENKWEEGARCCHGDAEGQVRVDGRYWTWIHSLFVYFKQKTRCFLAQGQHT